MILANRGRTCNVARCMKRGSLTRNFPSQYRKGRVFGMVGIGRSHMALRGTGGRRHLIAGTQPTDGVRDVQCPVCPVEHAREIIRALRFLENHHPLQCRYERGTEDEAQEPQRDMLPWGRFQLLVGNKFPAHSRRRVRCLDPPVFRPTVGDELPISAGSDNPAEI